MWGSVDRAWAFAGVTCSVFFASANPSELWGTPCYAFGIGIGLVFWAVAVVLLRIECNLPKTWALCHILWHVFPATGGMLLAISLKQTEQELATHITL